MDDRRLLLPDLLQTRFRDMKLFKFSKSFQRVIMAVLIPAFATVSSPVQANPANPA